MTELAQNETSNIQGSTKNPFLGKYREGFTVTIDASLLTAADVGGSFPGVLPKGFPLGPVTATAGLYGAYDDTAVDGRQDLEGLLFESLSVESATSKVHGAVVLEAVVSEADLPTPIDAAGKSDVAGRILFR